ncbi:uncharacterized protein BDZ99DRAFT_467133 [Mytilinidion resinicola]|uniref:Peptidase S54 rhomboid domain-containing protein n=1 Tax=Mytilinidion resinicola TaxID=574789 RepID=A0A6A6Y7U0_9PEZI|nr:uncharacterized protein BDZ99DRAFT_467133 [Mytilinidion resinicola]KAF2804896.1 hypothetical protein BDZ99DRAFT_467133 [Mytilinidion resinicola]
MNNVWPVASRLPSSCASLRPLTSTQSWPSSSLLRTARRSFTVLSRARDSPIPHPIQPPPRLQTPRKWSNSAPKLFSTTLALARKARPQPPSLSKPKPNLTPKAKSELKDHDDSYTYDDSYITSSLPSGPLLPKAIKQLFPTLSTVNGNRVLSILHTRRLTGSLAERGISGVDEALGLDLSDISQEQMMQALEYLRASFPVDEEAAAADWAEAEAARIEREVLAARGVNLGLLKKVELDPEVEEQQNRGEEWEGKQYIAVKVKKEREARGNAGGQGTEYGRAKYGRSVFETVRKSNEANWEAEKAERERVKAKEEAKMIAEGRHLGPKSLVPGKKFLGVEIRESGKKSEYVKKYEEKAQRKWKNEQEMEQSLTLAQRLWPSAAFTAVVCTLCGLFATNYEPPDNTVRLFSDFTPALATCGVILGINLAVWVAWRVPRFWPLLNKYMVSTPAYPVAFATLGNIFSHQSFSHLALNMTWLMTMGVWCHDLVGRGVFLSTYVAAGTCGSLASLTYFVLARNFKSASIGASGALNGVLALFCIATTRDHIRIPFTDIERPVNLKMVLAAFLLLEVYNMRKGRVKLMDHWAHLGGAAVGVSVGTALRWEDLVAWLKSWGGGREEDRDVVTRVEVEEVTENKEEGSV